jgi:NADPH:quinone reductase-like Zn-dependent oxidoreductase
VRILVEPDRAGLLALTELVEAGRLHVEIDSVFPLAGAPAAPANCSNPPT